MQRNHGRRSTPNSTSPPDEFFRASVPMALTFDDVTLATLYSEDPPEGCRHLDLGLRLPEPADPGHFVRHGHGDRQGAWRSPWRSTAAWASSTTTCPEGAGEGGRPGQAAHSRPHPGPDHGRAGQPDRRPAAADRDEALRVLDVSRRGRRGPTLRACVRATSSRSATAQRASPR